MPLTPERAWTTLRDRAAAYYRSAGPYAHHFARGKLGGDPLFRHLVEHGALPARARVLDVGCGQGLLAALLRAVDEVSRHEGWPQAWAPPPVACRVTGIELMPQDVERARTALGSPVGAVAGDGGASPEPEFICADMREAVFPACDAVVFFDALHYVDGPAQDAVLARAVAALQPGGTLLMRVGDAQERAGYAFSQWVDRTVARLRGLRIAATHGRPLTAWVRHQESLGLNVEARPMSQGTPFANVLLVARKGGAATEGEKKA